MLLEGLRDKVKHTEAAYAPGEGESPTSLSTHRRHMLKTIDALKTKSDKKAAATGLGHADWGGLMMAAVAGTFQGIGWADSFMAGREQKQNVETMVM